MDVACIYQLKLVDELANVCVYEYLAQTSEI